MFEQLNWRRMNAMQIILILHYFHLININSDNISFEYATCPNIECRPSLFEFCAASSIGKLFDEYAIQNGFTINAKREEPSNTRIKIALIDDTESLFCNGIMIQRHLLSLMNTQNIQETGYAIDLLATLEKTELHKLIKHYDFWPLSYDLNNKYERREFFNNLPCDDNDNHLWIFKNNDHRGTGVKFLYNPLKMRRLFLTNNDIEYGLKHHQKGLLLDCNDNQSIYKNINIERFSVNEIKKFGFKDNEINYKQHIVNGNKLIAQQFENTFLINNRRFSIRTYVVILSLNPYIVLHGDGYLALSSNTFDEDEINKFNVLSNIYASKYDTNNHQFDDWGWTFLQFEQYLNKQNNIQFTMNDIKYKLKEAVKSTFLSTIKENGMFTDLTQKKLDKYLKLAGNTISKSDNNYIWLAVDHLVTIDGNTKLLEINLHPGTTFLPKHCSWNNLQNKENQDWQCQLTRNITKEIFDISFQIAYIKMYNLPLNQNIVKQYISYHDILIYRDF